MWHQHNKYNYADTGQELQIHQNWRKCDLCNHGRVDGASWTGLRICETTDILGISDTPFNSVLIKHAADAWTLQAHNTWSAYCYYRQGKPNLKKFTITTLLYYPDLKRDLL